MPSAVAAYTPFASTGGTITPAAVAVSPLIMKSRRVITMGSSLELELWAGEHRVPALGVGGCVAVDRGGAGADHAVELVSLRSAWARQAGEMRRRLRREVEPCQPRRRRDPAGVDRPPGDVGWVV